MYTGIIIMIIGAALFVISIITTVCLNKNTSKMKQELNKTLKREYDYFSQ